MEVLLLKITAIEAIKVIEDEDENIRARVLEYYYIYFNVFNKYDFDLFPLFRLNVDYKIELIKDIRAKNIEYLPLYKISIKKLEICK